MRIHPVHLALRREHSYMCKEDKNSPSKEPLSESFLRKGNFGEVFAAPEALETSETFAAPETLASSAVSAFSEDSETLATPAASKTLATPAASKTLASSAAPEHFAPSSKSEFSEDETPTSRLERIWGSEGLARIQASSVMVLGLGGVGSNCTEALARGGVGRLIIVDRDVVQPSNINRQSIAFMSTIGRKKTDVMKAMIAEINPNAQVEAIDSFVLPENLEQIMMPFLGKVDYVIDAIDTISTKLALAQFAEREDVEIRLVSSMGGANKLHPECLRMADIYETTNCPLCRVMRKEARSRGIRHLRVLYSSEEPVKPQMRRGVVARDRSNLGTASFMPPIMGLTLAGEVLRELALPKA